MREETPHVEVLTAERAVSVARAECMNREEDVHELTETADHLLELVDISRGQIDSVEEVEPVTLGLVREEASAVLSRVSSELPELTATESATTTKQQLMLTVESIGEKLKAIWEAIKAAFKKFFAAIANLFKQRGASAEKAAALVDKTITDLADADPSTPSPTPESIKPGIGRAFIVGNKIPVDFLARVPAILKGLSSVFVDNGNMEKHLETIANIVANRPVDQLNDPELSKDIIDFTLGVGQRLQAIKGDATGLPTEQAGDQLMTTGLLLGDVVLSITVPAKGQSMANTMGSVSVSHWPREGNNPDTTIPKGVTREQISATLATASVFLQDMATFAKSSSPRVDALGEKIIAAGDQLVSRGTPETEANLATVTQQLKKYVTSVIHTREISMNYGYSLCRALTSLAQEYS